MAVVIFLGVYFGDFLDSYTNQKAHLFTVVFSLAGIATAFYFVFKKLKND